MFAYLYRVALIVLLALLVTNTAFAGWSGQGAGNGVGSGSSGSHVRSGDAAQSQVRTFPVQGSTKTITLPNNESKVYEIKDGVKWVYGGVSNVVIGTVAGNALESLGEGEAQLGNTTDWDYKYVKVGSSIMYQAKHKTQGASAFGIVDDEDTLKAILGNIKVGATTVAVAETPKPAK